MNPARLLPLGFLLIFAGFIVLTVGSLSGAGGGSTSTGGFILIGPFPVVFGSGPDSGMLAQAGLVITVAVVALYIVMFLASRSRRARETNAQSE